MKDRSTISKSRIDKVKFSVPLPYIMWGIDFDDFIDILISQKFLEIYHNYKLHRNIDSLNDDKLLNKKENLQNEITMLQHELNIINNKLNLSE